MEDSERAQTDVIQAPKLELSAASTSLVYILADTKHLKLFSEEKSPLDIAVELDMPAEEAHKLYQSL